MLDQFSGIGLAQQLNAGVHAPSCGTCAPSDNVLDDAVIHKALEQCVVKAPSVLEGAPVQPHSPVALRLSLPKYACFAWAFRRPAVFPLQPPAGCSNKPGSGNKANAATVWTKAGAALISGTVPHLGSTVRLWTSGVRTHLGDMFYNIPRPGRVSTLPRSFGSRCCFMPGPG